MRWCPGQCDTARVVGLPRFKIYCAPRAGTYCGCLVCATATATATRCRNAEFISSAQRVPYQLNCPSPTTSKLRRLNRLCQLTGSTRKMTMQYMQHRLLPSRIVARRSHHRYSYHVRRNIRIYEWRYITRWSVDMNPVRK